MSYFLFNQIWKIIGWKCQRFWPKKNEIYFLAKRSKRSIFGQKCQNCLIKNVQIFWSKTSKITIVFCTYFVIINIYSGVQPSRSSRTPFCWNSVFNFSNNPASSPPLYEYCFPRPRPRLYWSRLAKVADHWSRSKCIWPFSTEHF